MLFTEESSYFRRKAPDSCGSGPAAFWRENRGTNKNKGKKLAILETGMMIHVQQLLHSSPLYPFFLKNK